MNLQILRLLPVRTLRDPWFRKESGGVRRLWEALTGYNVEALMGLLLALGARTSKNGSGIGNKREQRLGSSLNKITTPCNSHGQSTPPFNGARHEH